MPRLAQMELAVYNETARLGRTPRVLSYGGGVDSFCMLVSAIESGYLPDRIVFMDVGDPERLQPAEWPETYDHILDVAAPLAAEHGIPFHWIISGKPTGKLARRMREADVTVEIYEIRPPKTARAKLARGARGLYDWFWMMGMIPTKNAKLCTEVAKIERFNAWLSDTYPGQDAEVWIGFEKGEEYRKERGKSYRVQEVGEEGARRRVVYPLIDRWRLNREECIEKIAMHRLPVPQKSACVFCPFAHADEWLDLFERYPEIFAQIVELEERKAPTGAGYKLAQVFETYKLTPAQFELMKLLARRPRGRGEIPGRLRASFDAMADRKWITKAGALSRYGKAIYAEGRKTPPVPDDTRQQGQIVRRAHGGRPVVGVHYHRQSLLEWIEALQAERQRCYVADQEDVAQQAVTDVPVSRLRRR